MVGSFIYTIEATNGIRNGFWGGVCKATGNFGTSSGIAAAAILRMSLSQKDLYSYGWRVPFLISLLFGVVGVYLRQILRDDKEIVDAMKLKKSKTYQPITSKHEYPGLSFCSLLHNKLYLLL